MKFYSQNGEDYLLWEFFNHKPKGFFIDVGAFDGIHLSNTFAFEKEGWTGICIEPHPAYFPICKKNRIHSICLNFACVAHDKDQFSDFYIEKIGLLSGIGIRDNENDIKQRYLNRELNYEGLKKVKVPSRTLNAILEKYLPSNALVDFISIDVEGTEIDVLNGFSLHKFYPRVVIIEGNTEDAKDEITKYMEKFEYKLARELSINLFFAREVKDVVALQTIKVNCIIEKQIHPLGKDFTLKQFIFNKRIEE
jgi:FkbM family methyltransferase